MNIKAGTLVILSEGEYSSYQVSALVRALRDVDTSEEMASYLAEHPEDGKEYHFSEVRFVAFLTRDGGPFEEVQFSEYHFADYGTPRR